MNEKYQILFPDCVAKVVITSNAHPDLVRQIGELNINNYAEIIFKSLKGKRK